jgi:hypothetical protein
MSTICAPCSGKWWRSGWALGLSNPRNVPSELSISTHLGDVKRAVAFWRIEGLGGDPARVEDAKGGAAAQVRIIGEIAASYARRCTVREGDYAGADRPWIQFLRQISSYPELNADLYLTKIADGEAERLKDGN